MDNYRKAFLRDEAAENVFIRQGQVKGTYHSYPNGLQMKGKYKILMKLDYFTPSIEKKRLHKKFENKG